MYLYHTYVGTTVGVDIKIQAKKQRDKSRYQRRKEQKIADANANMEAHTMEGMTENLSDFTRETNIGKIIFHIMFFFTEICIILLIHYLNCKTRLSTR